MARTKGPETVSVRGGFFPSHGFKYNIPPLSPTDSEEIPNRGRTSMLSLLIWLSMLVPGLGRLGFPTLGQTPDLVYQIGLLLGII